MFHQVYFTLKWLCLYFKDEVGLAILTNINNNITEQNNTKDNTVALQQAVLHDKSDIIFSTPAGNLKHIQQKTLVLKHIVDTLVVDKADLVLSFG